MSVLTSIEVIECYRLFSIFWGMGGEVKEGLEGVGVQVGWGMHLYSPALGL